jgi:hypothetical protein
MAKASSMGPTTEMLAANSTIRRPPEEYGIDVELAQNCPGAWQTAETPG